MSTRQSLRRVLKRSSFLVGVAGALRGAASDAKVFAWTVRRRRMIEAYLSTNKVRKLHLGTSNSVLPGWLNSDVYPVTSEVIYLDATKPFPLADDTIDYVFSEHMIEHVDYDGAVAMLRECRRVLKPTGRIRIATPDLDVLLGLHGKERTEAGKAYVDWIVARCLPGVDGCEDVFVINNAFRAWGHRFLYDRETLRNAMVRSGFRNIRFYKPGMSGDENLKGLESHGGEIQAEHINQFETFVTEGDNN